MFRGKDEELNAWPVDELSGSISLKTDGISSRILNALLCLGKYLLLSGKFLQSVSQCCQNPTTVCYVEDWFQSRGNMNFYILFTDLCFDL